MRWLAPLLFIAVLAACGSKSRDLLVRPFDAGVDATADGAAPGDAGPDADPTLGGPCVDDPQCDDHIACTYDKCDPVAHRCRNTPDDAQCDDGVYCNGKERCVLAHGCEPGPVVTCEDGDSCTIDLCIEATKSCAHDPRDLDLDGDPDAHCVAKHDCDDTDPNVASTHSEVCANGKDDNCNGVIDETPCVTAQGDTCATATAVSAPGTYALSTFGDKKDYATSCSVTTPASARDAVVAVTVPPGPLVDLDLWGTASTGEIALDVEGSCGAATSELACGAAAGAGVMHTRARALAPGTYFVIVTTASEATIALQVAFLTPTPRATNEACANAASITPEVPVTVSIIDPTKDLASACPAITGELTYALTLTQTSDVRVFSSTLKGSGAPVLGLRAPHCTDAADELRCRVGSSPPLFARSLAPGTYVITVAASSPIDASVLVKTYAPTIPPADESCLAPPAVTFNASTPVDLTNNEDAIKDGCFPGGPNAAFDVPLSVASDVMLVGRFPQNEVGALSFDGASCAQSSVLVCGSGTTPVRVNKRNVPAGDYRAVVADSFGEVDALMVLVRPTVPPLLVTGADVCATAVDVPATGGFFAGDTTNANGDYDDSCDTPNAPPGGAPDQVLRLVLAQPERVILNMDGSTYTTLLDVRQGPACPGTEVPNACYVGFTGPRSFIDIELQAGSYWIIVDGYAGAKGPWNLDVRVLPP